MANEDAEIAGENTTCYALLHRSDKSYAGTDHRWLVGEIKKTKKPVTVEYIHFDKNSKY